MPARSATTCSFPPSWLDIWLEPAGNNTVSILQRNFAAAGQCVLQLEGSKQVQSFILRSSRYSENTIVLYYHTVYSGPHVSTVFTYRSYTVMYSGSVILLLT